MFCNTTAIQTTRQNSNQWRLAKQSGSAEPRYITNNVQLQHNIQTLLKQSKKYKKNGRCLARKLFEATSSNTFITLPFIEV